MVIYHAYRKEEPVFYIGKTIHTLNRRRLQHEAAARSEKTNSRFHKALKKYGPEAFDWKVLEECHSKDELNTAEIKWIALVKNCGHKIYNLTDGGDGGDVGGSKYWKENGVREETKEKISQSLKEYYQKHPNPRKGIKTGTTWNKGLTKHDHPSLMVISQKKMGVPRSEDTKQKLREANLGKSLSDEAKSQISLRTKGALNPSAKSIICTTTGEVFAYAKIAAEKYDIDLSSIIKCCRGKIKSCKKMQFEYYPQGWQLI